VANDLRENESVVQEFQVRAIEPIGGSTPLAKRVHCAPKISGRLPSRQVVPRLPDLVFRKWRSRFIINELNNFDRVVLALRVDPLVEIVTGLRLCWCGFRLLAGHVCARRLWLSPFGSLGEVRRYGRVAHAAACGTAMRRAQDFGRTRFLCAGEKITLDSAANQNRLPAAGFEPALSGV